jgi:membrane-associated HD superfamily phosphohydrolase
MIENVENYGSIGIQYGTIYYVMNQVMTTILVVANSGSSHKKFTALYVIINAFFTPVCLAIGTVPYIDQLSMKDHFSPSVIIFLVFLSM